jgi:hypothetical protein
MTSGVPTSAGPPVPEPTAAGTLGKTPFPHLLVYLLDKQLTGTIELAAPDGEGATLLVLEGYPSKARTSKATSYLSHVLIEAGLVTEDQLAASMQRYRPGGGKLHGQVLLEMGILDPPRLLEGLRRQVIRKLEHLFDWPPETTFTYYDGFDGLSGYGAADMVTVDPLPVVWASIKQAPSWEHAHVTLSRVGSAALRLAATAQLDRLELTNDERTFIELLRPRPRRLYEMTSAGTLAPSAKQLLVYCLLITRQLEILADHPASGDLGPSRRSAPAPPPPANAPLGRMQLHSKTVKPTTPQSGVIEQRAPGVRSRDTRASSPTLTPVPKESIEAAIAEATRGLAQTPIGPTPQAGSLASLVGSAPPIPAAPTPVPVAPPVAPSSPPIPPPPSHRMQPASTPSPRSPPPPASHRAQMASSAPPPSSRSRVVTAELSEMRERILKRSEEITRQDYFAMLGVPRDADTDAIQKAYFLLAKVWHPDRLPREIEGVREQCGKVFAHMSEAHQTLTDSERRKRYETLMKEGGATPDDQAQIGKVLDAATNFQKAEICLKRNDLVQAEQLVRLAFEGDPMQADYLALLAWLEAIKPENHRAPATERRIAMLDRAIKMSDKCSNAYYYRGLLYKRLGNEKQAYKDFKDAADLNPRNIDAIREVRIYAMRKGSQPPPGPGGRPAKKPSEPPGGIFGKLFKK